jgi:drug/metabolite transporter (DMT)-like permease
LQSSGFQKSDLGRSRYVALFIGIAAVSTGAIFARLANAHPIVIAAYRTGLSTVILIPIAWWKAGDEIRNLSVKDLSLAGLSGFFLSLHFALWISSLNYTSIANSVVLVNTNPLWVALFSFFMAGRRLKVSSIAGIFLGVAGGAVIGADDYKSDGALFGDLLAVAGGICAALYLLLGKNLRERLSLVAYITLCYGSAALFLWTAVIFSGLRITGYDAGTVASFFGLAIISQLTGHTCFNWALKWFSPGLVAVTLLGEPVGSSILAYIIFGEKFTMLKIVGGAMILAAIYLSAAVEGGNKRRLK